MSGPFPGVLFILILVALGIHAVRRIRHLEHLAQRLVRGAARDGLESGDPRPYPHPGRSSSIDFTEDF